MKPSYQPLTRDRPDGSLAGYWVRTHSFGFHWHYHPEIELCYIHRGTGTRMVGDSVRPFHDGDLVLLGSNLPHTWISQKYDNDRPDNMQVFVLQFHPDVLSASLLHLPEFVGVQQLMREAASGVAFTPPDGWAFSELHELESLTGISKLLKLLDLLHQLSIESRREPLASPSYAPQLSRANEKRMQAVFGYIHSHFTQPLSLETIADIACLNPASFCRYFKKMTGQTLLDYLNDLRINRACQLLIETSDPILVIAERVGFGSFTNFSAGFARRRGMSPSQYRRQFGR